MDKTDWKKTLIVFGAALLLLTGLGIAGLIRDENSKTAESGNEPVPGNSLKLADSETGDVSGTGPEESDEAEGSEEIILTGDEKNFLDRLSQAFSRGDLEGGARLLSDYRLPWKDFPVMYYGGTMKRKVFSSYGLVFTKASTVFYGSFSGGVPQGECSALQVLDLEEGRRYDYAYGTWSDGRLEGEGECGYNYYDGTAGDIAGKSSKRGTFRNNRMEGTVIYTSTGADNVTATWQFQAAGGIIVLDGSWIQDKDSSGETVYKLTSREDAARAYALTESDVKEELWRNLISYEKRGNE